MSASTLPSASALSASSIAFSIASLTPSSASSLTHSKTLLPFLLVALTFTFFLNKNATNETEHFPPLTAKCSAFSLLYVIPLAFAPCFVTNALTTSVFPALHAKCKAVKPSVASAATRAPLLHNKSTHSSCPPYAAKCNGVLRSASTASKSTGSSASAATSAPASPFRAASCARVVFGAAVASRLLPLAPIRRSVFVRVARLARRDRGFKRWEIRGVDARWIQVETSVASTVDGR